MEGRDQFEVRAREVRHKWGVGVSEMESADKLAPDLWQAGGQEKVQCQNKLRL